MSSVAIKRQHTEKGYGEGGSGGGAVKNRSSNRRPFLMNYTECGTVVRAISIAIAFAWARVRTRLRSLPPFPLLPTIPLFIFCCCFWFFGHEEEAKKFCKINLTNF